jgi:hypothetical protein
VVVFECQQALIDTLSVGLRTEAGKKMTSLNDPTDLPEGYLIGSELLNGMPLVQESYHVDVTLLLFNWMDMNSMLWGLFDL